MSIQRELHCPHCGGEVFKFVAEWDATSKDDPDNQSEIDEHQCQACSKSFWT